MTTYNYIVGTSLVYDEAVRISNAMTNISNGRVTGLVMRSVDNSFIVSVVSKLKITQREVRYFEGIFSGMRYLL